LNFIFSSPVLHVSMYPIAAPSSSESRRHLSSFARVPRQRHRPPLCLLPDAARVEGKRGGEPERTVLPPRLEGEAWGSTLRPLRLAGEQRHVDKQPKFLSEVA
jgi:hypothetical protein